MQQNIRAENGRRRAESSRLQLQNSGVFSAESPMTERLCFMFAYKTCMDQYDHCSHEIDFCNPLSTSERHNTMETRYEPASSEILRIM